MHVFDQQPCAHKRPTNSPGTWPLSMQVTREVGQECLQLVEQQRIDGGLLGAGHSWVARPGEEAGAGMPGGPGGASESTRTAAPAHTSVGRGTLVLPAATRMAVLLTAAILLMILLLHAHFFDPQLSSGG